MGDKATASKGTPVSETEIELARSTRILHILTESDSVFAESALIAISAQAAQGLHVAVAARPEVLDALGLIESGTLRLIELPIYGQAHPADPKAAFALHKLYRHIDLVHAHGLHAAALAGLGLTGLPKSLRPVIVDTVGNERGSDRFSASQRKFIGRTATRVLGSNAAVVEEFAAAVPEAARAPLARPDVIRNLAPAHSSRTVRKQLGIASDVVLVASPVALVDGDVLTTIAEAALRLPAARADRRWAFVFTGTGPARTTLETEIAGRAEHVYVASPSQVVDVLAAAEVVVAAAQMSTVDAAGVMQLRRPVVFVGADEEAAAYGQTAVRVPATDTSALLHGIEFYADRPTIRTQMAFAAADRVLATTDVAQIPARVEADYTLALEAGVR